MWYMLYLLSAIAMLGGAFGMAMLVRIVPHPIWFGVAGAFLSAAIAGGWLLSRASTLGWPRLRTGKVLIAFGAGGALVNLWQEHWLAAAWSALVLLAGLSFAVRIFPGQTRGAARRSSQVQPPVTRREQV